MTRIIPYDERDIVHAGSACTWFKTCHPPPLPQGVSGCLPYMGCMHVRTNVTLLTLRAPIVTPKGADVEVDAAEQTTVLLVVKQLGGDAALARKCLHTSRAPVSGCSPTHTTVPLVLLIASQQRCARHRDTFHLQEEEHPSPAGGMLLVVPNFGAAKQSRSHVMHVAVKLCGQAT